MLRISFAIGLCIASSTLLSPQSARAQFSGNPTTFVERFISNRPTLSPYLNLTRNSLSTGSGMPNYHAMVRPALEQRRRESETRETNIRLQREANAARSRGSRSLISTPGVRSTGHPSRFRNFLHFYPKFSR